MSYLICYAFQVEKVSEGKAISLFIHFLITFSSANSWAFVRNNAEICCVLNQLGNKALSATIGEELRYIQFSVRPNFYMIENLVPKTV